MDEIKSELAVEVKMHMTEIEHSFIEYRRLLEVDLSHQIMYLVLGNDGK